MEKNIDEVSFAGFTFPAWYPSWFPKEIIGEKSLDPASKNVGITVPTLYVCKKCFAYSKIEDQFATHLRHCTKDVPGQLIYTHGGSTWSIWEVDGDVDKIFCQNLSLFGKLFLKEKSVFYDVVGFNYFLLVNTSPNTGEKNIVGFFSKEKKSWDNNNLACILIFPPWQKKGLGSILMGVSYEIARREEILGGPEKPISELGMKGYRRYWGAEIARWILEFEIGKEPFTIRQMSQDTWIHGEDCIYIMREMGLIEQVKGKGGKERMVIDKVKVRAWVEEQKLDLARVVDLDGFVEGYAFKKKEGESV